MKFWNNEKLFASEEMIHSLQSWRFIFALMIFFHHFFMSQNLIQLGTFPVAFFFILSGYVLSISYEKKVEDLSFSYKNYIIKRILRIQPLNLICLMLALCFPLLSDIVRGQIHSSIYLNAILDVLLVQAIIPVRSIYFSGNSVAWFLSCMLFFYIFFPYLLKLMKRQYGDVIFLCSLFFYFIFIPFVEETKIQAYIYISPLCRVIDFIIGIKLFFFLKNHSIMDKGPVVCSFVEFLSIVFLIASLMISRDIPIRFGYASFWWIFSVFFFLVFSISEGGGGNFSSFEA